VAGKNLVPEPATATIAFLILFIVILLVTLLIKNLPK
jgi:hypothetical protein